MTKPTFEPQSDTSPRVLTDYYSRLSKMTPDDRFARCLDLCATTRAFVLAGILHRHPGISSDEQRKRYAAITLGADFTRRHYSWDPDIHGY